MDGRYFTLPEPMEPEKSQGSLPQYHGHGVLSEATSMTEESQRVQAMMVEEPIDEDDQTDHRSDALW